MSISMSLPMTQIIKTHIKTVIIKINSQQMNVTVKMNHFYRQQVLHILESYQSLPKDDKLTIRKYISHLKDLGSDPLIKLIISKGKEADDRKLQIILRKQANAIRKHEHATFLPKKAPPKTEKQNTQVAMAKKPKNMQSLLKIESLAHSKQKKVKSLNSSAQKLKIVSPLISPRAMNLILEPENTQTRINTQESSKTKSKKGLNEVTSRMESSSSRKLTFQFPQSQLNQIEQMMTESRESKVITGPNQKMTESKDITGPNQKIHKKTRSHSWDHMSSTSKKTQKAEIIAPVEQKTDQPCQSYYSLNQKTVKSVQCEHAIHRQLKSLHLVGEQFFDFLIGGFIRMRSPSSFTMPYHQLMSKLASFIMTTKPSSMIKARQDQEHIIGSKFAKSIMEISENSSLVFYPFDTQFDIVTVEKLSQFITEYMDPQLVNNRVRNIFMRIRIGIEASKQFQVKCPDKISIHDFRSAYQWKSEDVRRLFEVLIQDSNLLDMEMSYWELYWLKDGKQFQQFYQSFYRSS